LLYLMFHLGFSLDLLFNHEDGGMFPRNVAWFSTDYMALYPRRKELFITTAVRTSNPNENSFRATHAHAI
jgi:hypothetical protein